MKVLSLFSGIGGFDLAFERAGHEVVSQVEINTDCRKVLASHFNCGNHGDILTVGRGNLPPCDVIVGGFPCQDLSVAGRREGLRRDNPPSRQTGKEAAGTFTARTSGGGGFGTYFECQGGLVAPPFTSSHHRQYGDFETSGGLIAPARSSVRRITPTEALRLQGFPDDWLDGLNLSDSAKYRMIGNAVAVPVVEWIARRMAL